MAITIYDIQKLKETKYEQGFVSTLMKESDLLKILPIEKINGMSVATRRMNSLPTTGWRARGERFTDGGQPGWESVQDSVYNIGSEINIDYVDLQDEGPWIQDPLEYNTEARAASIAYNLHNTILNGDQASDPNQPDGLIVRIGNLGSSQTVYANSSSDFLDCRPTDITVANAQLLAERVDEARHEIDGHFADVAFTSADWIRAFKHALRITGQYVNSPLTPTASFGKRETSAEPLGKPHFEWDGTKFYDLGLQIDQSTQVVGTTTVNSQACRPVYFARLGGKYLTLIQNGDLDIGKPFMLEDGVSWRVVIKWLIGMRHVHNRFASRLLGTLVA